MGDLALVLPVDVSQALTIVERADKLIRSIVILECDVSTIDFEYGSGAVPIAQEFGIMLCASVHWGLHFSLLFSVSEGHSLTHCLDYTILQLGYQVSHVPLDYL